MDPYLRHPEKVMAQQWHARDPFIGPMRYDHAHPNDGPYLVIYGGGRQQVSDGDWVVRDSYGRYSVVPDAIFKQSFEASTR